MQINLKEVKKDYVFYNGEDLNNFIIKQVIESWHPAFHIRFDGIYNMIVLVLPRTSDSDSDIELLIFDSDSEYYIEKLSDFGLDYNGFPCMLSVIDETRLKSILHIS